MLKIEITGTKSPEGRPHYKIKSGEYQVCRIEPWAFSSCGVAALSGFQMCPKLTAQDAQKMVEILKTHDHGGWMPEEYYFLLTTTRIGTGFLDEFLSLSYVKKVDVFTNKAHGPEDLHLFRFSYQQDFK